MEVIRGSRVPFPNPPRASINPIIQTLQVVFLFMGMDSGSSVDPSR